MKAWIFLTIFICLLSPIVLCDEESGGKLKSQELREKTIDSEEGLIRMNGKDYQKYVMEFPRPYDLVIYFTARNCQFCLEKEAEFIKTAQFYKDSQAYKPFNSESKQLRAVYFVIVTFTEDTRKIYLDLDFKSAPNLVVFSPKVAILSKEERTNFLKRYKWSITPTDGHVTVHKILEYVNKHTGREVEYKPTIMGALTVIGAILGTLTLGVGIFITFRKFFLNSTVWLVGSIAIYVICAGGLVHNIIHNIPMTTQGKDGQVQWFSTENRQQLGAEGFVMSGCFALIGILIALWNKVPAITSNHSTQRIVYLSLFFATWFFVKFAEDVYTKKGWYNPRFYAPDTYIKGPLMRDQGNNI